MKKSIIITLIVCLTVVFLTAFSSITRYMLESEKMRYEHEEKLQNMEYVFDLSEYSKNTNLYMEKFAK